MRRVGRRFRLSRRRSAFAAHTLHEWVKQAEVGSGAKPGLTPDMAARLKALERGVRELRQANGILRKASAYCAMAELDCPFKR